MNYNLEKRFKQLELQQTPNSILECLFQESFESRTNYEKKIYKHQKEIKRFQSIIDNFEDDLKKTRKRKDIKSLKLAIKKFQQKQNQHKKFIRIISINTNILWKNELKIAKILGYDLV